MNDPIPAGMDILRRVEAVGSDSGAPSAEVEIVDCGMLGSEAEVEAIADDNKALQLAKLLPDS